MRESIKERREKVAECLRKNMSETLIAKHLGVARQTIVRDVAFFKRNSPNWLDGLAKDGFTFEYQLALEKIKNNGARLEELYSKTDNLPLQIVIIRESDRNAKLYLELLGETPAIHAYKRATQVKALGNVS